MNGPRTATQSKTDKASKSGEEPDADKVSSDDRHKTEKLTRHDGIDPNEGQE